MVASRLTKMAKSRGLILDPGEFLVEGIQVMIMISLPLLSLRQEGTYPSNYGRVYIENGQLIQKHLVIHQVKALGKIGKKYPNRGVSPVQKLQYGMGKVNKRMCSAFSFYA